MSAALVSRKDLFQNQTEW